MRWWLRVIVAGAIACTGCATGSGGVEDAGRGQDASTLDGAVADAGRDGGRDASVDAMVIDSGPRDSGMPIDSGTDAGAMDSGPATCPPTATNLAIVELMIRTETGTEDRGEWIELLNAGDCLIDLGGLEISSPPATYTIPAGHLLEPGERFVLAQSTVAAENRGLVYDLSYTGSNIVLDNNGDTLALIAGGTTIDSITWSSAIVPEKYSFEFPDTRPIAQNASLGNWCQASISNIYSNTAGGPYYGTPGAPNGACP
ncbi:lamin tail domain-containing protein [Sandaracinus amylolyticus]|uniref:lamin tail domain-containing protein n=1 Tax=Sandaracinus amylolyticus TaxID=927083 RepID=UPI001F33D041|nr:lamin tail domain-containing protein [Sandaracinus amylolyticus]